LTTLDAGGIAALRHNELWERAADSPRKAKPMIDKLKQAAMQRGMKLISNPRVMKVMADPRVMKIMMQAFQLRGKVRAGMDARTAALAKSLGLATREEVATLRKTIRGLESTISSLEEKLEAAGNSKGSGATSTTTASASGPV